MIEFIMLLLVLGVFFTIDLSCAILSSRLSREEEKENEKNS